MNFGEKVLRYRTDHDMSLDELAKAVGISKQAINRYELSQRVPKIDTAYRFAKAFGVPIENLIDDNIDLYAPAVGAPYNPTHKIPILGRISAGLPLYAEEHIEGYTYTELNHGGEYFALRVSGDSMTAARISEGDILIVRCQDIVENGEIAVVMVNGDEATVKRFHRDGDTVTLTPQSYNPAHQPQVYNIKKTPVRILGRVVQNQISY